MQKIRLFPAAEFVCEDCGRNCFISLIGADVPEEVIAAMKQEMREEFGVEEVLGDFLIQPTSVECKHCGAVFEAEFDN